MRARLGHMISPLCEKTRSTGADVAGEPNNRLNSSFSLTCDLPKYACHYDYKLHFSDKIGGTGLLGTLARSDTEFCVQLPVLLEGCPSFLLSLPTCALYYIGCLSLSGHNIVLLQWYPGVSFAAPPVIFVTSAEQCRFWQPVGCCILLREVTFRSLGPI